MERKHKKEEKEEEGDEAENKRAVVFAVCRAVSAGSHRLPTNHLVSLTNSMCFPRER